MANLDGQHAWPGVLGIRKACFWCVCDAVSREESHMESNDGKGKERSLPKCGCCHLMGGGIAERGDYYCSHFLSLSPAHHSDPSSPPGH